VGSPLLHHRVRGVVCIAIKGCRNSEEGPSRRRAQRRGAQVDLVLSGHVHAYARTCNVADERCVDPADGGMTHFTIGAHAAAHARAANAAIAARRLFCFRRAPAAGLSDDCPSRLPHVTQTSWRG
jgi:hypothetical protein